MPGAQNVDKSRNEKLLGIAIISVYVLLRMIGDPLFWRNIPEYYSYSFEIAFIGLTYFLFRKKIALWKTPGFKDALSVALMISAGFLIYRAAGWLKIPIPFDLTSYETIFLLLILAPLLEELIFRMALWKAFEALAEKAWITISATTILFAAGHFAAFWFVPDQFRGFVVYQALYVLFLGTIAGLRRIQEGVVSSSVLVHFGFNFGFFLASRFFG